MAMESSVVVPLISPLLSTERGHGRNLVYGAALEGISATQYRKKMITVKSLFTDWSSLLVMNDVPEYASSAQRGISAANCSRLSSA
jgi:hypothetical protein